MILAISGEISKLKTKREEEKSYTMPLDEEKRQFPRAKVNLSVVLQTENGVISTGTHDISVDGAFIRAQNPLGLDEVFKIFIKIPNLDRPISPDAQVVWVGSRESNPYLTSTGIGVKFVKLSNRDRNLLERVVSIHPHPVEPI